MAAKTKKIYAIFSGRHPGLYKTWDEASVQITGFKGAKYKSFKQENDAITWLRECIISATEPVDENIVNLVKANNDLVTQSTSMESDTVIIYTDGGASPNPGIGGYGIVLMKGRLRKELSAGYEYTTNNRMELLACIVALRALKESSNVKLHTDSKYVVDSISKGWAKGWQKKGWRKSDGKTAENIDLWKQLLELIAIYDVEFVWVKGHAGNVENERCDVLANQAKTAKKLLVDTGYTPTR